MSQVEVLYWRAELLSNPFVYRFDSPMPLVVASTSHLSGALRTGVDDMLSSTRRDYFLGFQVRFNDRDLKTILPFVGAR